MYDCRGHAENIIEASKLICETFTHSPVYRIGGDEFLVIAANATKEYADKFERDMVAYIDRENNLGINPFKFSISVGYVLTDPASDKNVDDYVEEADVMMYEIKNEYHKTHPGIS